MLGQTERYKLTVFRYIEVNPVRAGMVGSPAEYRWSSVQTHMGRTKSQLITPHEVYLHLGSDAAERVSIYAKWLHAGLAREDEHSVRLHLLQERALDDQRFQAMVERALGRPTKCRPRGRPAGGNPGR
ncbi:putative transposase [Xanthomonas arboricola]|uniref:hypothetical protein n=1 Tax=Xanthomonas euroxanthea TaxID=2259622 RepID=UPI00181DD662|nr:hypothetical protein [Xanthomonas euroxanthea]MBB3812674.1 putative transposase [Xanthomonas euroxanthea]